MATAAVVAAAVLLGPGLTSGPTAGGSAGDQSTVSVQPDTTTPTPSEAASPLTTDTPGSAPSGELSPGEGRAAAANQHVPAGATADLWAAVRRLTEPRPAHIGPESARLVSYRLDSWRSPSDFTLGVTVDLRFGTRNTMAWNEGANTRFVRFTRSPGRHHYRLTWATSPF